LHLLDTASGKEKPAANVPPGIITGHPLTRTTATSASPIAARVDRRRYSLDATTGKGTRWTFSETGGLDATKFPDARAVRWKSFDGRENIGILVRAAETLHGQTAGGDQHSRRPEGQARPRFPGPQQLLLNEWGVAMLYPKLPRVVGLRQVVPVARQRFLCGTNTYKDIKRFWTGSRRARTWTPNG